MNWFNRFGHDLVEELVTWLNRMDTTYRTDLRELNELNYSRFDAKLEQRLAQSDAKLEQRLAGLRDELHAQGKMLMRWMVGLWITAIGLLSGLIFAAGHFLPAARP